MPQEQGIGDTLAVHSMPLCAEHIPASSSPRSGGRGSSVSGKNVGNRQHGGRGGARVQSVSFVRNLSALFNYYKIP